jgi:uncharacterized protein (DUF1501 family)
MQFSRREFLVGGAGVLVTLGGPVRRARAELLHPPPSDARPRLFLIHLRGGADGLSLLVPHADPAYRRWRRSTALAADGGGAPIDLDGRFGLHPRLTGLAELYARGELSALPAVGLTGSARTRSHAQAERKLIEVVRARSNGQELLQLDERARPYPGWPLLDQLEHACKPRGSAIVWANQSGWDTHVAQSAANGCGRLADQCAELDAALLQLRSNLAEQWRSSIVAMFSEFGRSVAENSHGGTDDGAAGALLLLGGMVAGGTIHGASPELSDPSGVPVTVDLAGVLGDLVEHVLAAGANAELTR